MKCEATGTWQGLLIPKGTPDAVVTKVGTALQKALGDPGVRECLKTQDSTCCFYILCILNVCFEALRPLTACGRK